MQRKQGISLIVLVITIIVMIILAAAIILSLNNAGIIGNANKAVEMTDEANVSHIAQLGWSDAYIEYREDVTKLKEGVEKALVDSGLNPDDYGMIVTTKGVDIVKGWIQDGTKVIKGDKELQVGGYIDYISGVEGYEDENGWQVLGAENGNLLLLSREYVQTDLKLSGKEAYNNINDTLKNICIPYGKGYGAIGARSIEVSDIDKVEGYINPYSYFPDELYAYGNEITFYWDGTEYPYYIASNDKADNVSKTHSKFVWESGESIKSETATKTNKEKIITITNNIYAYAGNKFLSEDSDEYKMLFKTSDNSGFTRFWVNSKITAMASNLVSFGTFGVNAGKVNGFGLFYSDDSVLETTANVRAVVLLNSNINVSGDLDTGYIIQK